MSSNKEYAGLMPAFPCPNDAKTDEMGMMTLEEWSLSTGAFPEKVSGSRLVIVACDILDQRRKELWNLSDYRVSSVSGVSVHLMPKGG
ncbi:hypothetical protein UFOVP1229_118 [uncultured Caudovirales phage]|uniref:Uncharacterized protein n=1 Tax=uncultured Caudovirales phage TaxID=2100421 RepID=A0A6J5RHE3_9CAUD|nr:hypothetical protein UFOVP1229_118 [uncultured Caudovirales phage]